jgi:hypothetical protein
MEQHIISYFSGIIAIAEFMVRCGIPPNKLQQTKEIILEAEYDFFAVNCSNPLTASEQAELSIIVNNTANKLTQLNK